MKNNRTCGYIGCMPTFKSGKTTPMKETIADVSQTPQETIKELKSLVEALEYICTMAGGEISTHSKETICSIIENLKCFKANTDVKYHAEIDGLITTCESLLR